MARARLYVDSHKLSFLTTDSYTFEIIAFLFKDEIDQRTYSNTLIDENMIALTIETQLTSNSRIAVVFFDNFGLKEKLKSIHSYISKINGFAIVPGIDSFQVNHLTVDFIWIFDNPSNLAKSILLSSKIGTPSQVTMFDSFYKDFKRLCGTKINKIENCRFEILNSLLSSNYKLQISVDQNLYNQFQTDVKARYDHIFSRGQ